MMERTVREGFEVKYKVDPATCILCKTFGGVCGYDRSIQCSEASGRKAGNVKTKGPNLAVFINTLRTG